MNVRNNREYDAIYQGLELQDSLKIFRFQKKKEAEAGIRIDQKRSIWKKLNCFVD